ncbi:hypothetical protein RD792_009002 [Penstemon davidsonii]|uniref:Bet v I/Major latex protein domain-containing protein n=1 Tax=Penstemon davidsonii TaxID=160366 RepID=A0ABR0DAR0_9LAMI|nr:hypothetical protein RD792_009002 [Penstemon davidsonii]
MALLPCKLIAQVAFKAGGDVFHHLLANNPKHLANVTPGKIQGCDLHQGEFGKVGSVTEWKYTLDEMATLACKLIAHVAFKAGGDVFHHLLANKPHHLANIVPGKIQACDMHQGDYGKNGSVIQWKYTLDGKDQTLKEVIQDVDEKKRQISYKVIEGDMMEFYKNIIITVHVETRGGVDFIAWTIDYELLNVDNPHPLSLLELSKRKQLGRVLQLGWAMGEQIWVGRLIKCWTVNLAIGQDDREVIPPRSEVTSISTAVSTASAATHGVEIAVEFKPVEHPTEPFDNDQPIQCPLPEPSILNDGRIWKERVSSGSQRRPDLPVVQEHNPIEPDQIIGTKPRPPTNRVILPSASAPEHNFLKFLEECNASGI